MSVRRAAAGWRSLLFVPATRPELVPKALASGAKAVIVDLEDAVPAAEKERARSAVAELDRSLPAGVALLARVNGPATPWFEGDLAAVRGLSAVVVPKLESSDALDVVAEETGGSGVLAGLETVRGVVAAADLLRDSSVVGCYFGAEDHQVDLGGFRTASNDEVALARAMVATAARLAGRPAFDMVLLDLEDEARFGEECLGAGALGYRGKLCVHPRQVAWANEGFAPSVAEVARARRLLDAFDGAVRGGRAAIEFEGTMVDEVVARRARQVLAEA